MRRKIELLIDGRRVDLDDNSFILLNYAMSDMQNPTIVKNSYSQSITIPGTESNNAIFGCIFRDDRITGSGNTHSGADFNVLKRTPFEIRSELGEILESGYCRLDSISRTRKGNTYSLSLFGGLGDLFYHLSYKSDGTQKTLADLYFDFSDGKVLPDNYTMSITRNTVYTAWLALQAADNGTLWHQFNFAPCYNGLPSCKFDADKAVYTPGATAATQHPNLYTSKTDSGTTYTTKSGASGAILLEMGSDHTEWQMQDLRSYLQRPVISVKWLLTTIAYAQNTGDYTLVLDSGFFKSSNPYYESAWMTLPMFDRDNLSPSSFALSKLLTATSTPADYLIGFAKMFGLVFVSDPATKTITLMGRKDAYNSATVIDIEDRIEAESSVNPIPTESKYLIFNADVYGQFAAEYAEKYSRDYGSQWVDTGADFDASQTDLLDTPFKGAADVLEADALYQVFGGATDSYGAFINYLFKIPFFEDCKWRLYHVNSSGETEELECEQDAVYDTSAMMHYSLGTSYNDFLPKVQLHGDDNKGEDGSNVLLFFDGMVATPEYTQGGISIETVDFILSDDSAAMLALNSDVPCWEASVSGSNVRDVFALPSFRRWRFSSGALSQTWDFGDPRETAVSESLVANKGIYPNFWADYIADRYDKDTRVVTCKVDLSGYEVGQGLLRKFWYFGGAIWVMNSINNYSLTTYGLTECTFVKVQDITNYRTQNY